MAELPLKPALCTKTQIANLIKKYYVDQESVRDLLVKAENNSAYGTGDTDTFMEEERKDISEMEDDESDLLQFVNRVIADAVDASASDIHIEPRREP